MAKKTRQNKLTRSAKGQDCQVRLPGYCCFDPDRTMLAHIAIPGQHGVGMKALDVQATYACSVCHGIMDGQIKAPDLGREEVRLYAYDGMSRTLAIMIDLGLIEIHE